MCRNGTPLARMSALRAATLYRSTGRGRSLPPAGSLVLIGVLVVALVGAAATLSGEVGLTLAAFAGVAGALGLLQYSKEEVRGRGGRRGDEWGVAR